MYLMYSTESENNSGYPDKKKPKKVNELIPLSEGAERRRLQAGKALHRGTGAAQLAQDAAPSLRRQEPLHGTHQSKIRLGRYKSYTAIRLMVRRIMVQSAHWFNLLPARFFSTAQVKCVC